MKSPKFTAADLASFEVGLAQAQAHEQADRAAQVNLLLHLAALKEDTTSDAALARQLVRALTRALQCELLYQERARHHAGSGTVQVEGDSHGHA
jgi:hypothetical protein